MLTKLNVAAYTMMDVVKLGVDRTLAELLSRINPKGDKILHVSIDTDSLDPLFAPSTTLPGMLVLVGLTWYIPAPNKRCKQPHQARIR